MLRTRYALRGTEDLYHIEFERSENISILPKGKNIELRSNISINYNLSGSEFYRQKAFSSGEGAERSEADEEITV